MIQLSYHYLPATGPCYLFLHGFLGDSSQWDSLNERYFTRKKILKIDLPGHGSSKQVQNYKLDELSRNINAVLIDMKIDKVHVVGHSMGGYLGCAFAKAYPQKILSLTLINSITAADSPEKAKITQQVAKAY